MRAGSVLLVACVAWAVPCAAEKAVRRDGAESAPSSAPAEERHPASGNSTPSTPTPVPTREPERASTPVPTSAPTAAPTPAPTAEPAPTRSDAERRHPRPERDAEMPTPAPTPSSPTSDRGDDRDRDRTRNRRRDSSPGDLGPARRGHVGPHYHEHRYVPRSCFADVETVGVAHDEVRVSYDGLATMRVFVDPGETRVFVDADYTGIAEDFDGLFERLHVSPGCHEITLERPGYRTHKIRVHASLDRGSKLRHRMEVGGGPASFEDQTEGICGRGARVDAALPEGPLASTPHDFDFARERWFLAHGRSTAVLGLIRVDRAAWGASPVGAASDAGVVVVSTEARREGEAAIVAAERESRLERQRDGSFVVAYRIDLAPGRYALRLGVHHPPSGRRSVITESVDVPDIQTGASNIASVQVLESMQSAPSDERHPLAALALHGSLPVPRFGNVFRRSDSPLLLLQFSLPASSPAAYASYLILGPDGRPVANEGRLQPDLLRLGAERAIGASAFGPISLAAWVPGRYRVIVTVTDTATMHAQARGVTFDLQADLGDAVARQDAAR